MFTYITGYPLKRTVMLMKGRPFYYIALFCKDVVTIQINAKILKKQGFELRRILNIGLGA